MICLHIKWDVRIKDSFFQVYIQNRYGNLRISHFYKTSYGPKVCIVQGETAKAPRWRKKEQTEEEVRTCIPSTVVGVASNQKLRWAEPRRKAQSTALSIACLQTNRER